MGNSINTDKIKKREKKTGDEELGYSSGLCKLEAGSGYLRLSFHWGTSFAGDLGGFQSLRVMLIKNMTFWKLCSHLHVNDTIWGRVSKNFSDI
jgi:hypothetical protein